ncbi:SgcJ/EcaC family oxidoreductase [Pantoea sp. Lij88]|uniref:SgcJ/EcaC family oxidoreductase n=1 Tax=Pantoea sp. Lij88 TaxID=3028622 RepID=UPI0024BB8B9F|nr:SgcJ/EcaC family oxidoreductase [Pantoea sp. Lij88]WHQ73710.1 SgcJ/EcaC family oxidoreductase [Pantoea sp. Lij88]
MKKTLLSLCLLGLATVPAISMAQEPASCVKTSEQDVASLFNTWNETLATGDATKVSQLYASDAVLLPTISNQVRLTDQERIDYFKDFLQKGPSGKIDSRTIRIGCNKAIDTGVYTFTFKDKTQVTARYTFTYVWDGKGWKISTHHSSAMPESVSQ